MPIPEMPGSLNRNHAHAKFGMFLGVFTPSVLTILGVIMYLRLGWVVANAGLFWTLLIVLSCSGLAFITGLSASAVATNMAIGGGGEYFLISRSVGLTIGGAIGIPLFLCRTLSVTLYCFGLSEALMLFWPAHWGPPPLQAVTAALIVVITLVAGKSAAAALKLQLPLMALVGVSLLALAAGVLTGPIQAPAWGHSAQHFTDAGGFWGILAVFFPAVTGFTAGIGLSGDLKNPQKTIPRGTLMAIAVGALIYLLVPVLLACTAKVTPDELGNINPSLDPIWTRIAVLGAILVMPGMWSAILSSAFGSALAGPRVLQALARDGLAPAFLARTSKTGQPYLATWIAGAIALATVALGNLNTVAQVVTVFFLTLYLSINLVAATEGLVRDPSYRPTLSVPWVVSLLGAAASLVMMFLISPWGCLVAIGLELLVWLYLRRKDLQGSWGDVWAGVWGSLARISIHRLTSQSREPRSWRPNILLFSERIEQRAPLVQLCAWFNQNRGILTVCDLICGKPPEQIPSVEDRQETMDNFFGDQGILAFGDVVVVEQFAPGVIDIVQAHGMGALRSNTIAFGWANRPESLRSQLTVIRTLGQMKKAVLVIRSVPAPTRQRYQQIDLWWRGTQNNGDLMLLLAHLLTMNPQWRHAQITVRSIVTSPDSRHDMETSLAELTDSVRIKAQQDVIVKPEDTSVIEIMHQTSKDADLVFVGLTDAPVGQEDEYAQRLTDMVAGLPTTVLVRNSGPFRGQLL